MTKQRKTCLMYLKTTSVKKVQYKNKTSGVQNELLDVPINNASRYGSNSITSHSILNWNYLIQKVKFNPYMTRPIYCSN